MCRAWRKGALAVLALWAAAPLAAKTITVTSTKDEKMPNNSYCVLRQAVQAAFEDKQIGKCDEGGGADEIVFDSSIAGGTIELTVLEPIHLSSDLTITGPMTISGLGKTSIFEVGSAIQLRLEKLTLKEAFRDGGGGALAIFGSSGTTEIVDCTFTENKVDELGAGILNSGATVTITGSKFTLNQAGTRGGALAGGGVWTIEDSEFLDNTANGGGAVFCSSGTLTITRSDFIGNVASGTKTVTGFVDGGGAVMSGCVNDLENDLFKANFAFGRMGGGALFVTAGEGGRTFESVFELNSAWLELEPDPGEGKVVGGGGAILVHGDFIVDRSAISRNYAHAIAGGGGILFKGSDSVVVNSSVLENVSTLDDSVPIGFEPPAKPGTGGGISVFGPSLVKVTASSLVRNQGVHELYLDSDGNGSVELRTSLLDAPYTDETCGGNVGLIFDSDLTDVSHNLQSEQFINEEGDWDGALPTCPQTIPKGKIGSAVLSGDFIVPTPSGTLKFNYPKPALFGPAHKNGNATTCQDDPVWGKDLLNNPRSSKCTIGAVELPVGG